MPYKSDEMNFNRIADRLYAAALAYDRLVTHFSPGYQARSNELFDIWDAYESNKL